MGLLRGIFITTAVAAFFAAAPDVYHACAQVDGTSGASSVVSSGNTEKALHVLVYERFTKTIAPDKAEVKFSVYDTAGKTVTELTRATLQVKAGLVEVPLECNSCTLLLQASSFPYLLAFEKKSVKPNDVVEPTTFNEFSFKGKTYTYGENSKGAKDQQYMAIRIGTNGAAYQLIPFSFESFVAAYKKASGSIPNTLVTAPLLEAMKLIESIADSGQNPASDAGGSDGN